MLPKEPYKRFAVITMYVAVAALAVYIIFNYLWEAILPFVVAYIFAECFKPIVKYAEAHERFPKKTIVLFVILLAAAAVAMLIYALARQLVLEIGDLLQKGEQTVARMQSDSRYAEEIIEKINGMVPFVDIRGKLWELLQNPEAGLWSAAGALGERLSDGIFAAVGSVAKFLPNLLLSTAVIIIATYYFAIERVKVNCFFLSLFPKTVRPLLKTAKDVLADTVGKYLRAYGILFFITFAELLAAFMIIKVEYALVIALIIALIDILPVFGAGLVLIPWGIFLLTASDYGRGIGILVTYAVITVIRQVIEPKIVGKFIGLSPLAALAAMYIGLKLMGVIGIFVLPIAAIVVKKFLTVEEE